MKIVLLVLLITLSISFTQATKWHELEDYTFEDYCVEFGKGYEDGSDEYNYRQAIFESKLEEIKDHNQQSNRSYKKGVNQFTDQTPEEFSKKKGFSMSVHTNYFKDRLFTAVSYQSEQYAEKMKNLPPSVDWREKGIVSTIKDQGECGSCWAFASTSQLESYTALNTGHLETLSVEQIVSCTPNPDQCGGTGGCNGAIAELAFEYVQQNGITTEWKAPYQSYFGVSPSCSDVLGLKNNESALIQKNKVSIGGYVKIIPNSYDDLMYHIAYVGPLAISVDAGEWNDYEEGVFDGCSDWNNITIDHAVQLVGYGTDAQLGDYFLIRNSWDTTFGELGYIRMKREANPPCGTDQQPQQGTACVNQTQPVQVCGQCGMLYDSSYPTNATLTGLKKQTKI